MTGFEFIAKAFKASYTDIAKRLDITTSTVADWASGRRAIPKNKLPVVSKLFKIDEAYFKKKELTEVEKIKIEINYLERASKRDSFLVTEVFADEEDNEQEYYRWHDPYEGELRYKYEELAYEEVKERVDRILNQDFHLELQVYRPLSNFHVLKQVADLLEQDEFAGENGEQQDITEEEVTQRRHIAKRINALHTMVKFLNGDKPVAFGKVDPFSTELFQLLQKYGIISTQTAAVKEQEDIFDQVDPVHIHE